MQYSRKIKLVSCSQYLATYSLPNTTKNRARIKSEKMRSKNCYTKWILYLSAFLRSNIFSHAKPPQTHMNSIKYTIIVGLEVLFMQQRCSVNSWGRGGQPTSNTSTLPEHSLRHAPCRHRRHAAVARKAAHLCGEASCQRRHRQPWSERTHQLGGPSSWCGSRCRVSTCWERLASPSWFSSSPRNIARPTHSRMAAHEGCWSVGRYSCSARCSGRGPLPSCQRAAAPSCWPRWTASTLSPLLK